MLHGNCKFPDFLRFVFFFIRSDCSADHSSFFFVILFSTPMKRRILTLHDGRWLNWKIVRRTSPSFHESMRNTPMLNISLNLREKQRRSSFKLVCSPPLWLRFRWPWNRSLEAASFIFAISLVLPVIMISVGKRSVPPLLPLAVFLTQRSLRRHFQFGRMSIEPQYSRFRSGWWRIGFVEIASSPLETVQSTQWSIWRRNRRSSEWIG